MCRAPLSDDERAKWAQQLGCKALKDKRGWCCKIHFADETLADGMHSAPSMDSVAPTQGAPEVDNEAATEYIIVGVQQLKGGVP